jgi:hypothetical protein
MSENKVQSKEGALATNTEGGQLIVAMFFL